MSKKTYKGNLDINKKTISIETDYAFQAIQIDYVGTLKIESLLPNNYVVVNKRNKVIVAKIDHSEDVLKDLFNYKGVALISKCIIVTKELETYNLYINKTALEFYNTLIGNWENYTIDWENIEFDGNNDKNYYTYRKRVFDKESKTYTQIKELRKK